MPKTSKSVQFSPKPAAGVTLSLFIQTILCDLCALWWLNIRNRQHVAGLLPIVLPTNQLTINDVADVAGFSDLYIHTHFDFDPNPNLNLCVSVFTC
jgi:hypothetical protein